MLVDMMGLAYKLEQGGKQGLACELELDGRLVNERGLGDKLEQVCEWVHVKC